MASPLLANVYPHYVFDLWAEKWREKVARRDVIIVRYADDLVVGFQHQAYAERFLRDFQERLAKFGLEIQREKTRLIAFGRFRRLIAGSAAKVWRRTLPKRMRAKLHAIKRELRRRMHEPVAEVGAWLKRVVDGYYPYHAVPGNLAVLAFSRAALPLLAARSTSSQPAAEARLGATAADL